MARTFVDYDSPLITYDDYGPGTNFYNADQRGGPATPGQNGKVSLTNAQAGAKITRDNATFGGQALGQPATVSYGFKATDYNPGGAGPNGTGGFNRFNATQIVQAELALQSWSDVANLTFTRVGTGTTGDAAYTDAATILFSNYTTGAAGAAAFAYFPGSTATNDTDSDVFVNSTLSYEATPVFLAYGRQTFTHEIGHALGLNHPGAYNAGQGTPTYENSAEYYEDTRQYSLMSYWSETKTGGNNNGSYAAGPLLDDITAVQRLYGANMSAFTGNTTYGFNSNTGRDYLSTTSASQPVIFAAWDAGGTDTFDFSGYSQGGTIDLRQGYFSSVGGLVGNVTIAIGAVIENAIGGSGAETITGNSANNVLRGNGGADILTGGAGADTFVYASASDSTGAAVDTITDFTSFSDKIDLTLALGASGNIAINRSGGLSTLYYAGSSGTSGTGQISIQGVVQGSDLIIGANANVYITGDGGNDGIYGSDGTDYINGGGGDDSISGGIGADQLTGGSGVDTFFYSAINQSTAGRSDYITDFTTGQDRLDMLGAIGVGGAVAINRSGTASTIYFQSSTGATGTGQIGVNGVVQGSDFNIIAANNVTFYITADGGADTLIGSAGVDYINGGGGNDLITGGAGADVLTGGAGADTFSYIAINQSNTAAADSITDFATGEDRIDISSAIGLNGAVAINRSGGLSTIYFQGSNPAAGTGQISVTGIVQGYDLSVDASTTFYITGDTGTDVIYGSAGRDVINGGGGDDAISGGVGADQLTGGAGADTFYYSAIGQSTTSAGDYITDFTTGLDRIDLSGAIGAGGAVAINRSGTASTIYFQAAGGAGGTGQIGTNGIVQGYDFAVGANTTFYITGDNGADVIYGSNGADVINGGGGDDAISGGLGADTLTGGAGADTFYYSSTSQSTSAARDTITDFVTGTDKINITALGSGGVNINYNGTTTTLIFGSASGGVALEVLVTGQVKFTDIQAAAGVAFGGNGAPVGDAGADYVPAPVGYEIASGYAHGLM